jgi:hypothetical protein
MNKHCLFRMQTRPTSLLNCTEIDFVDLYRPVQTKAEISDDVESAFTSVLSTY